jgi:AcrR family transcriptional regulator
MAIGIYRPVNKAGSQRGSSMTPLPNTETKDRILQEAERLFAAGGFDGVSMREIAEACGVTKANIYYYFESKERLYLEVLQADMLALIDVLDEAARQPGSSRDRILGVARSFWDLMRRKHSLIQITMRQFGGMEQQLRGLVQRYQDEMVGPIQRVLEQGIRDGEVRPLNARLAAAALLGMLSIFVASYLLEIALESGKDGTIDQTVDLFFDGVVQRCENSTDEPGRGV